MRHTPRNLIEKEFGVDVLDFLDKNNIALISRTALKRRNDAVRELRSEVDHLTKKIESIQKGHLRENNSNLGVKDE